jgi:hypothetical protein
MEGYLVFTLTTPKSGEGMQVQSFMPDSEEGARRLQDRLREIRGRRGMMVLLSDRREGWVPERG